MIDELITNWRCFVSDVISSTFSNLHFYLNSIKPVNFHLYLIIFAVVSQPHRKPTVLCTCFVAICHINTYLTHDRANAMLSCWGFF